MSQSSCAKSICPHIENGLNYAVDPVTHLCAGCLHAHMLHLLEDLTITHMTEDVCDEFACVSVDALDDVISSHIREAKAKAKKRQEIRA